MTISKKLLIAATLVLGINQVGFAYNACALGYETNQILNFAQTLRQVNHKQALKVAHWLEQQVCTTSCSVSDEDIVAITNVINNYQLTIQSKISVLSQAIAAQRSAYIKARASDCVAAAFTVLAFGSIVALAIYDAIYLEPYRPKRPIIEVTVRNCRNHYNGLFSWYHYCPSCFCWHY
jgi:hypothetical protein